jgi:hypothetical protein
MSFHKTIDDFLLLKDIRYGIDSFALKQYSIRLRKPLHFENSYKKYLDSFPRQLIHRRGE